VRFPQIAFLVAFLTLPLVAQSPNGTINGLVLDPSTRVIAGADVLVINDVTGVKYSTKTNNDGIYVVPNLPPGPYRLQVSKVGFKTLVKPDIVLNVQDALSINFTLPVGAILETLTVKGGAPLVNYDVRGGQHGNRSNNPDNGSIVWSTPVGPGASLGGIEWGTATDGKRIYVAISNSDLLPYTLVPSGQQITWGAWSALDVATGERSFGRLQILPPAPLTGARSASQMASCMWALTQDRCTPSTPQLETFSGASRAGARSSMGHLSWTAPSIGDLVTVKSVEPETTKSSPLVWPARKTEAGRIITEAGTPTITIRSSGGRCHRYVND